MSKEKPSQTGCHFALREVGRSWGERVVLSGLSFEIAAGERVALIGPSGGGKSTLLKLLVGRLRPTSGELLVNGQSITAMSQRTLRAHRRACAYVEQGGQIYPGLSVFRNVQAGRLPHWPWWKLLASALWPIQQAEVHADLTKVGLASRLWDPAQILSGGQQQRVAIARALHTSSSVLLFDEPTAALDPATAHQMVEQIIAYQTAHQATLFWCTHWLSLIQPHVTRVLGLREGRIAFDLPPEAVQQAQLTALYEGSEERIR